MRDIEKLKKSNPKVTLFRHNLFKLCLGWYGLGRLGRFLFGLLFFHLLYRLLISLIDLSEKMDERLVKLLVILTVLSQFARPSDLDLQTSQEQGPRHAENHSVLGPLNPQELLEIYHFSPQQRGQFFLIDFDEHMSF